MADTFLVEVQSPDGIWTDITDYVDIGSLGSIEWSVEDSLLSFQAGDITIGLKNPNDIIRTLFAGADPTEAWMLRIWRNEIMFFNGPIELRASLRFEEKEIGAELTAYGPTKLLTSTSAESVRRTFTTFTVSGTINQKSMNLTPAQTALARDDVVRIASAVNSEGVVLTGVNAGRTTAYLTTGLQNTWPAGTFAENTTPYHRRITPSSLVTLLFANAGITNPTIDLSGTFDVPVASPMNTDTNAANPLEALGFTGSGILRGTTVHLRQGFIEYEAASPSAGGFASVTTIGRTDIAQNLVDWQLYATTEPTNVAVSFEQQTTGVSKQIYVGVDYLTAPAAPRLISLLQSTNTVPAPDVTTWTLSYTSWSSGTKQFTGAATNYGTLQTYNLTNNSHVGCILSTDYDSRRGLIFFAYGVNDPSDGGTFGYWDIAGAAKIVLETSSTGSATASMGQVRHSLKADMTLRLKSDGVTMQGWRGGGLIFQTTVPEGILMRSIRYTGSYWVAIIQFHDVTKLFVADLTMSQQVSLPFSDTASQAIDPDTGSDSLNWLAHYSGTSLIGIVDGQYVVIDTIFGGVIVYADFEGQTTMQALSTVAKLLNAVVFLDLDLNAYFIGRTSSALVAPGDLPKALDGLIIEDESDQVWEQFFETFRVTTPAGISVTIGDPRQDTPEVQSSLVPNQSVAGGLAFALKRFYSVPRRERRVTVIDDDTRYALLQRVVIGTDEWIVYAVSHNIVNREVGLRLVEAL